MYCYLCSFLFFTFLYPFPYLTWVYFNSDEMGNKGAFITMGTDTKPNYTTYDAVVSSRFWFCYRRPDGWRGGGGSGDTPVIWITCPRGISTPVLLFSYSASPRRETHGLCELLDVYVWIHVTGMRVPPYNLTADTSRLVDFGVDMAYLLQSVKHTQAPSFKSFIQFVEIVCLVKNLPCSLYIHKVRTGFLHHWTSCDSYTSGQPDWPYRTIFCRNSSSRLGQSPN